MQCKISVYILFTIFKQTSIFSFEEKNETACITQVELIYFRAWNYLCLKGEEERHV